MRQEVKEQAFRVRIKPVDIEVPPGDPFKYDTLDRKDLVEVLAGLIRSVEGPGVIGIDADWGYGKTTFIRMLHRLLEDQDVPVVAFNAWESDYVSDPFTAIVTELTEGLPKCSDEETRERIKAGIDCAKAVMRARWPAMLKALLARIPMAGGTLEEIVDGIADAYVDERISAYRDSRKTVEEFKKALRDIAQVVSPNPNQQLLVVTIDELDRCRPSYAVELLEVAKHLFDVDGVVFVVAVNRKELANSVQALYGPAFDASGYLDRFFDEQFRLPIPSRSRFIKETVKKVGIRTYLSKMVDEYGSDEISDLESMLIAFFGETIVSLRIVARALHHLGLVYGTLADIRGVLGTTTAALIILHTLNRDLYYRFVDGRATDAEVVDGVVALLDEHVRAKHKNAIAKFEAWMIAGQQERDRGYGGVPNPLSDTPLMKRYRKVLNNRKKNDPTTVEHAIEVLEWIDNAIPRSRRTNKGIDFLKSVNRIELFSSDFNEQPDGTSK